MIDKLSSRYTAFLDGTYECIDRIVLNAYFQFGQRPAGFRTWWRQLEGSDEKLDNAHLMRMASRSPGAALASACQGPPNPGGGLRGRRT